MVLVKAKRDDLLGPLSAVSGIIERRHTLPILSNVLLERSGGKVSFLATDIEVQIRALADLDLGQEAHAITVGARKLVDILRALPGDAEVTLQMQDKRMLVKAGKSRFMLQTLPAEDFPRLAKPTGEPARFALPCLGILTLRRCRSHSKKAFVLCLKVNCASVLPVQVTRSKSSISVFRVTEPLRSSSHCVIMFGNIHRTSCCSP